MTPEVISLIGIFVAVAVFMILIFKGITVLVLAPVTATIVLLFSGSNIIEGLTGPFMAAMAKFIQGNFFVFLLSSMFGKMMADSGAANGIAVKIAGLAGKSKKHSVEMGVFALIAIYTVLCYGGGKRVCRRVYCYAYCKGIL